MALKNICENYHKNSFDNNDDDNNKNTSNLEKAKLFTLLN